jgi:hypothetical protein
MLTTGVTTICGGNWNLDGGTLLTLWTNIGRRFIAMGAAGWHICFDVLERLLAGEPIGPIVSPEAMKFGWQWLHAEYAKQFGIETRRAVSEREDKLIMKEAITRSIFRWIHIILGIPIIGYIYSPFEQIPNYAPATRFVFVPVIVLSGLWMWKGHVLRRLLSKRTKTAQELEA